MPGSASFLPRRSQGATAPRRSRSYVAARKDFFRRAKGSCQYSPDGRAYESGHFRSTPQHDAAVVCERRRGRAMMPLSPTTRPVQGTLRDRVATVRLE
jgi:hypothetical protein